MSRPAYYVRMSVRYGGELVTATAAGTFAHGNSYIVTGTGFGTKTTAAPIKYDDFQSVTVGNEIITSTATGPAWENNSGMGLQTYNPIASTASLRSGTPFTRNMRSRWQAVGGAGADSSNVSITSWSGSKVYVDFWYRYDASAVTGTQPSNVKPIRMYTDPDANTGAGLSSYNVAFFGPPGGSAIAAQRDGVTTDDGDFMDSSHGGTTGSAPQGSDIDQHWTHWSIAVSAGSGSNAYDGEIYVTCEMPETGKTSRYTHNSTFHDLVTGLTGHVATCAKTGWLEIFVGNYTRSGDWQAGVDVFAYTEAFYLDTSWARVEIGNNATYLSCTHREIQIPTSWSATSVTFTVNRGSFRDGDTVYLFVTDSSNTTQFVGTAVVVG